MRRGPMIAAAAAWRRMLTPPAGRDSPAWAVVGERAFAFNSPPETAGR